MKIKNPTVRVRDIENRPVVAKGKGAEMVELGVWNEQMQTSTYAMDKQQGPTV